MNLKFRLTTSTLLAVLAVGGAQASPIVYDFTGLASGTVGSQSFTDAAFDITVVADTSGVANNLFGFGPLDYGILIDPNVAEVSIGGVGSGTFLDQSYVFDNQKFNAVGFGVLPTQDDLDDIPGSTFGSTAFETYDLQSAIGPLGGVTEGTSQFVNVSTSLGSMTVTGVKNNYFQAYIPGPTPEPITTCLGIAGIGLAVRRRMETKSQATK